MILTDFAKINIDLDDFDYCIIEKNVILVVKDNIKHIVQVYKSVEDAMYIFKNIVFSINNGYGYCHI